MTDIDKKVVDVLDKLEALATQYAPEVVDAAVSAVQVSAFGELINGVIGIFCVFALMWLTTKSTEFCRIKKQANDSWANDWEIPACVGFGVGILACSIWAVNCLWALTDIWMWTALFNPELALAHKILGL